MKRLPKKEYISIRHDSDILYAADQARCMSEQLGFVKIQYSCVSLAVSELANNIYKYARSGNIIIEPLNNNNKMGIQVTAEDDGPGIQNISEALREGFSTKGTLGLGLMGVSRLMDEFNFDEKRKTGTKITVIKWI